MVLYVPRIEASMPILRNILLMTAKRYKALALPLPKEFCRLAIMNPGESFGLLTGLGNSFVRLWGGWVPAFLRDIMVIEPLTTLDCYDSIDRLRRFVDLGVEIARLVIRFRLSGRVDYDEWLRLFRRNMISLVPPDRPVVVIDDYAYFIENYTRVSNVILLGPLIPTPIDLVALITSGKLSIDYLAGGAVNYAISYIGGDYVVVSRDLTEAFLRLINNREYMSFVRSAGLPIIT